MYPVGTKCVITWHSDEQRAQLIGQVVNIVGVSYPSTEVDRRWVPLGTELQTIEFDGDRSTYFSRGTDYPCMWMIPVEPDTSIMEDAEEIKRLADEIIS